MRSKTSYFNATLFKKNLARFWPLWGGASLLGTMLPLYLLTVLIREDALFGPPMNSPLEVTLAYYSVVAWMVPAASLLYACLCALAAWGWLYNARSVGLYHSLPITRKGLFATDFLSGMAMMLLPYAVTGGLTVLLTAAIGGVDPAGLAVTVLAVTGESFFYFAAATLIVFVTGNPFAFAGFYFLFHFLAAGAEWLASRLMSMFYFGVERAYEGVLEFLSPTLFLMRNVEVNAASRQITTPDGWIENGELESVTLQNGWLIAAYALAGVILLGCAWALYRRRRSESAGDVVAVGWMKPVFRYGVALCAAFSGGMILYSFFCEEFQSRATAGALPMAVCMAAAGIIGYYIASMLLSKSLQVFRGSWKGALATVLASAGLCLAVAADPFGLEAWLPREGEVREVQVYLSGWNGPALGARLEDPAAVREVLDAHGAILAQRDELSRNRVEGDIHHLWLDLGYYEGAEGEKRVSRSYWISCSPEQMEELEALRKLAALASSPAVQEANIFSRVCGPDRESRLTGGYLYRLYNPGTGEGESLDLTLEQAKVLEAAVRRDVQAGHFGRTLFLPDGEYERAAYSGDLELYYSVSSLTGGWKGQNSSRISLSLSSYCTETLKALEDLGVTDETHRLMTYAELNAIDSGSGSPYGEPYDGPYGGPYSYTEVVY